VLLLVGGFLALDATLLHWYRSDTRGIEEDLRRLTTELDEVAANADEDFVGLEARIRDVESTIENELSVETTDDELDGFIRDRRIAGSLAILSLS
jgi:hypothetical protein